MRRTSWQPLKKTSAVLVGLGLRICASLTLACVSFAVPAWSAPFPLGPQFQVDSYTPHLAQVPRIDMDGAGNFIVVWDSYGSNGSDTSEWSIQGQRFDSEGAPIGTQFQVNTFTSSWQRWPDVAADAAGNFVVVWQAALLSGSVSEAIQAQRFDSVGAPLGTEFQVNTETTSFRVAPRVASDPAGNFIVAWKGRSDDSSAYSAVKARRFDNTGSALGTEFRVSSFDTPTFQDPPGVAVDENGIATIVWDGIAEGAPVDYSIQARRYDAFGAPLGPELTVTGPVSLLHELPSVAVDGAGNFVVVWQRWKGPLDFSSAVHGRRFDETGAPVGTEFLVSTYATGHYQNASVTADPVGNFVVVWQSSRAPGPDRWPFALRGRRYDNTGATLGTEFQVNASMTFNQFTPAVVADAGAGFIAVWSNAQGEGISIQGQRFSNVPLCGPAPEMDAACHLADATGAGRSSLRIKDAPDDRNDRLKWTWARGGQTVPNAFKAPTTEGAIYRLCVYDGSGSPQPLLESDIPVGANWSASGPDRFAYDVRVTETLSGIIAAHLRAGLAGRAKIQVTGKGALLHPLATDSLTGEVVVQLLIDDGASTECFKTAFPGPSGRGAVTRQDATHFEAKGP